MISRAKLYFGRKQLFPRISAVPVGDGPELRHSPDTLGHRETCSSQTAREKWASARHPLKLLKRAVANARGRNSDLRHFECDVNHNSTSVLTNSNGCG